MEADRGRRGWGALGAVVVAVAVVAGSPPAGARMAHDHSAVAAPGSSCANPEVLSVTGSNTILSSTGGHHIALEDSVSPSGGPGSREWWLPAGYIICSTRIQRADGTVVAPTKLFPYATPTPIGGEYDETTNPASAVSTLTITAAKSQVPAGTSCTYPQSSSLIETVAHGGPKAHIPVKLIEVSPTSLRLKITPHTSNVMLCPKADIFLWLTNSAGIPVQRISFYVSVKPHGGLSSTITVPAGSYIPGEARSPRLVEAAVFARIAKAKPKARGSRSHPVAAVASTPTTQFQCEQAYRSAQGREHCFSQLPGASCAHPLEAEKAGPTTRGDHRYFKLAYREEVKGQGTPQYGVEQHYAYAPVTGVRMCPYPMGAVYKVSLLSQNEHCGLNAKGQEECTTEYDTHSYPEPVRASGGHFHFYITNVPLKSWHLVVKGYFIHPPWRRRGRA